MRDIKFRAWNKELNIMSKPFSFGQVLNFNDKHIKSITDELIMQFTGLKDKNGVEIYEGSILQNPKNEIGIVVWSDAGLKLKCKRRNGDYFIIPLDQGFCNNKIIIGNIHENKDLLK